MFLDEIEEYISEYDSGVKKVSYRSSRPKILKNPIDLKMEKSFWNNDLSFNRKGLLLHSFHWGGDKNKNFKAIYGYDTKGKLLSAMKLVSETNELISISEFEYDIKGRIESELVRTFNHHSGGESISERIHSYNKNVEEVLMLDEGEEDEHKIYYTYDIKKRVVEEKGIRNDEEFIYWSKYVFDKEDNLIIEISLNDNGKQDGIYEYFPYQNKYMSGYIYKSEGLDYKREFKMTFNDKGHYINQVIFDDDEPIHFIDRTLEYY